MVTKLLSNKQLLLQIDSKFDYNHFFKLILKVILSRKKTLMKSSLIATYSEMYIWKVFSNTFYLMYLCLNLKNFWKKYFYLYLYLYLLIEKTVILNTNTLYFKKLSLYEVYFWQVKVLHDIFLFLKFLKSMLLHK